jgi:hypothetical protein
MDPVADILAASIKLKFLVGQNIGNLARDNFFDMLVGPVVIL